WEKAARGVDARSFPWGDTLDPAFCAMQRSFSGPPRLPTVHEFPADRSVYGVRGLGGLVRELCANGYERFGPAGPRVDPRAPAEGPFRMSRGGCIAASAPFCRAAGRFAGRPEGRLMLVGFRVARSVP
ncbi:MAG: SUMF1/EgtB/PvdO family nonheme iron enzyme, partial [Myxococcales bacterium]|nr:SUMF1/EgtB/PvdO family nonheme iron enzyme [Myxococcales bacterium]